MKQNFSCWGRRTGLLARAVLLSLAAGFLAGNAQAADFTKPITGNTDADYAGVKSGLTYTFTGDNTITPDTQYYQAGIDYSKYASGSTLTVNSTGKLSMNVSGEHQMMLNGIMNKSPNTMNINGDIDVKVNNTKDSGKSYGIYAWNTKGAKVDIIGNADISASAKNIAHGVDISSAGGWIDLEGKSGGTIRITADKIAKDSAAVSATGDSTWVNINYDRGSIRHEDAKVQINGDLYTRKVPQSETEYSTGESGTIYLGLAGKDSYLHGVMGYRADQSYDDYDESGTNYYSGDVRLLMKNGASWTNEAYASHTGTEEWTSWAGSKVAYLESDGGVIYQKDTNPITIDSYKGNVTVVYDHDAQDPAKFTAGDIKINQAQSGSTIAMLTGSAGLSFDPKADKTNAAKVLSALAQKLYYTGTSGNLTGTVAIASGLTSSTYQVSGPIQFSTDTTGTKKAGQGYYDASTDKPDTPSGDLKTGPITTSENIGETRQADANGTVNVYVTEQQPISPTGVSTLYVGDATGDSITVDVQGKKLQLSTGGTSMGYMDTIFVDDNKNITLTDSIGKGSISIAAGVDEANRASTTSKNVFGIMTGSKTQLTADTDVEINHVLSKGTRNTSGLYMMGDNGFAAFSKNLTIKDIGNKNTVGANTAGIYLSGKGNILNVLGNLDIENIKGSAIRVNATSMVNTSGGTITAKEMETGNDSEQYYAVYNNKGTVNLNTGKLITPGILTVKGDMYLSDNESSVVNLNLTSGSQWTGSDVIKTSSQYNDPTARLNVTLGSGASWIHETGHSAGSKESDYAGSRVYQITGNGGTIYQNSDKPITVYNYSGNGTVVYKHDASDPTKINGGDFTIKSAAADSKITFVTDSEGITSGFKDTDSGADRNKVSAVLNKLANKLFYSNYKDKNLSGIVRIAEGLTSSSATAKAAKEGSITFSDGTKEGTAAGQGYYDYTPASEVVYKTGPITDSEQISKTRDDGGTGTVTVKNSSAVSMDGSSYVSTMYAKDAYKSATRDNPMVVDLDGRNLALDAESHDRIAAAIYVTDNAHMNVKNSSSDKKLSITASNTARTAANGILVKGGYGALSIQGPVEINNITTGGNSANGIAVNGSNSEIHVDGPLTIAGVEGKDIRGMGISTTGIGVIGDYSKVTVNENVDITGVKGSSLKTSGADAEISVGGGTITAAGDGKKDHNYYAARVDKGTININMKDGKAGSNTTKITGDMYATGQYGKRVVEYSGGELVDWTNAGKLNVALTDSGSFWTGVAAYDQYNDDYGTGGNTMHDIDEVNLYLQNGAAWTNEQQSHVTSTTLDKDKQVWKGSQLASLHGGSDSSHAGIISQKDSNPITVLDYSGSTKVFYSHDESNPQNIIGGDFKIAKAEEGSQIELITDSEGIKSGFEDSDGETDKTLVAGVLNKLANKLYYTGYADGHLTGIVKIADGLTASSKELKTGKISFSDGTTGTKIAGQGFYDYLKVPASQTDTEFTDTITGVRSADQKYVNTGVLKDDGQHYEFTTDTTITAANTINVGSVGHAVDINTKGHTLTLDSETTGTRTISALSANSQDGVTITADKLVIKASDKGRMEAINVGGQGQQNKDRPNKLTINGDVDMQVNGSNYALGVYAAGNSEVTFNGNVSAMGDKDNAWGLTSKYGAYGYYGVSLVYSGNNYTLQMGPKVTINGDVNAKIDGNALFANGGHAKLTINGGGNIEINKDNTHHYYAMIAECGTTSMNVNLDKDYNATSARTNKLVLKGNISASTGAINDNEPEQMTNVNLGLATKDSEWTGVAYNKFNDEGSIPSGGTKKFYGAINLFLQNGATWNNEEWGAVETSAWGAAAYTGSHLTKLVGGDSAANAGIINQNDDHNITVDNYSGNTMVVYKHDIVEDITRDHAVVYGNKAASIIGGDFRITNAAADSAITLVTDRTGLNLDSTAYADRNLVNDTLDKLANKLYYTNYSNGNLKAYVQIAEGLTSSSITAALRKEAVAFYNADEANAAGKTESQGHYAYDIVYPDHQITDPMSTVIDGSKESKDTYRDNGIYYDNTDSYDFTNEPNSSVKTDGKNDSIIHAGDNNVNITNDSELDITAKEGGYGIKAENGKTVTTKGNTNISAAKGTGILADGGSVAMNNYNTIAADTGIEAKNGGKVSASGKTDITAAGKALHADGDGSTITLNDGSISGKVLAENKGSITTNGAALKGDVTAQTNGTAALTNGSTSAGITADGGTITTNGTEVVGEALAENSGTVAMTGGKAASVTADGSSATTDGTVVDRLISAKNGGTASMKNGSAKGLSADKDSTVTATLDKSDAKIDGNVANEGTASVNISNGAVWTGDSTGTGTTNANIGSGSIWTGASTNGNTKAVIDGTWTQTGASELASLSGSGTIDKRSDNNGDLNIASYSGSNTFVYNHSIVDDSTRENAEYYGDKNGGNKAVSVSGGNINIAEAAKGSTISLMTDRAGLNVDSSFFRDKNLTNDALDKLANKLYYHGTESLTGRVGFGEGLTAPSEWKNITFKKDGQGSYDYTTIVNSLDIQYGSEETAMMKGTKSALFGSAMMWRGNNNDIQRRMGDLRLGQGETGVWARYIGGKNRYDQQNTYLNQDYDIGQAGFDKKVGDWTVGLALDHGDGKAHYIGGKGKEKMNTLAVYGTRVSNDGRYFDVIVKTGQVKNKFDVSNEIGNKLHGDYKTWGNSISLEYGKRFVEDSGFYMDPSVEFTAGRLNGKNFKGTSDLGTLYVHQHGFNSAIGRIGFSIGRQQERSNIYAKFALAHEFGGSFRTDFYADDGGLKSTKVDLSDTWLDMELGGSLSLGKNVYLYGTYTRTFEADMATKWRADVGVRYTF